MTKNIKLIFLILLSILISCDKKEAEKVEIDKRSKEYINFVAIGDQGTGGAFQKIIRDRMEFVCNEDNFNFYLLLGDNFYWNGVANAKDKKFKSMFEDIYNTKCLKTKKLYAVLGNHDYKQNPQAQIDYSKLNIGTGIWNMPNNYYTKSFGGTKDKPLLQIVFLDTNIDLKEQIPFLKNSFKNSKAIWRAVAAHHHIRSFSKKYGDDANLVKQLLPTLKDLNIDLYISGHSHSLQLIEKPNEPLYIVSGSGGKGHRPLTKADKSLIYGEAQYGFSEIILNEDELQIEFYTIYEEKEFFETKRIFKKKVEVK